jgi:hypothetical protein
MFAMQPCFVHASPGVMVTRYVSSMFMTVFVPIP